jgi:hypothetical protein
VHADAARFIALTASSYDAAPVVMSIANAARVRAVGRKERRESSVAFETASQKSRREDLAVKQKLWIRNGDSRARPVRNATQKPCVRARMLSGGAPWGPARHALDGYIIV